MASVVHLSTHIQLNNIRWRVLHRALLFCRLRFAGFAQCHFCRTPESRSRSANVPGVQGVGCCSCMVLMPTDPEHSLGFRLQPTQPCGVWMTNNPKVCLYSIYPLTPCVNEPVRGESTIDYQNQHHVTHTSTSMGQDCDSKEIQSSLHSIKRSKNTFWSFSSFSCGTTVPLARVLLVRSHQSEIKWRMCHASHHHHHHPATERRSWRAGCWNLLRGWTRDSSAHPILQTAESGNAWSGGGFKIMLL